MSTIENKDKNYKGTLVAIDVRDTAVKPNETVIVRFKVEGLEDKKTYFIWRPLVENRSAAYGQQIVFNLLSTKQKNEVNLIATKHGLSRADALRYLAANETLTQWLTDKPVTVREHVDGYGTHYTPFSESEIFNETDLLAAIKGTSKTDITATGAKEDPETY